MNRGVFWAVALLVVAGSLSSWAEDMKTRKDRTVTNDYLGVTAIRPEANEWQIIQASEYDKFFTGNNDDIACLFVRYSTPTPDKTKDNPLMIFYVEYLQVEYIDQYGRTGLAKEIYKNNLKRDYKDVKDSDLEKPQNNSSYGFSAGKSVTEFAFTGVSVKYGNPRHVHVLIHKFSRSGFIIVCEGVPPQPNQVKTFAADEAYILNNMSFKKGTRENK